MGDPIRVMVERGKKKRTVACAFDWSGWDRSAKTEESRHANGAEQRSGDRAARRVVVRYATVDGGVPGAMRGAFTMNLGVGGAFMGCESWCGEPRGEAFAAHRRRVSTT